MTQQDTNERSELRELVRLHRTMPAPEIAKAIRRSARISQAALASELGVSRQAIGFWESGARPTFVSAPGCLPERAGHDEGGDRWMTAC